MPLAQRRERSQPAPPAAARRPLRELLDLVVPPQLRRVFAALVVLSAASFVVNQGTYAEFTATVSSPNNTFSTGSLELTTSAGASGLFTVRGMVPGDEVAATIDVHNAGTVAASSYTMSTSAETPSALTSDPTTGLQMTVDRCSMAWTAPTPSASTAPYSCAGTLTRNLASGAILQTNVPMGRTLAADEIDHLLITVSMPRAAANTLSGQSASVTFRWDAEQ
jgi:hypothetical protein